MEDFLDFNQRVGRDVAIKDASRAAVGGWCPRRTLPWYSGAGKDFDMRGRGSLRGGCWRGANPLPYLLIKVHRSRYSVYDTEYHPVESDKTMVRREPT